MISDLSNLLKFLVECSAPLDLNHSAVIIHPHSANKIPADNSLS